MLRWTTRLFTLALLAAFFWQPAAVAQEAPEQADDLTHSVDFEFEGLMFVQAKVNGKGPYKFLFDSGATQSVLNERLAKELSLELHDMPGGVQGVGEAEAKLAVLQSVEIGGFKRGKNVAAVMNFDHMSGTLGYHMMGIIGQNVIKHMQKIEIDFSQSKLTMTGFKPGEEPTDFQESLLIRMLEGGGEGLPGIPGIPGLPRRGGDQRPERPPPGPQEEEFSVPAELPREWLIQDGDEPEVESTRPHAAGMALTYRTGVVGFPPLAIELIPYWYLDIAVNGKTHTFMFDTGASMMMVLGTSLAEELSLTTSFSYPVKGIGKGQASSGLLDTVSVGTLKAADVPCTIMDLPVVSDQLGAMTESLPPMFKQLLDGLDFDGIVGITLATRFKKMIVDTKEKRIEFVPYAEDETNLLDPYASEDFVKDAVIRTWQGKAAKFSLDGDSVPLEDWKKLGLENGGLQISSVVEEGAAAKAGLKPGDIITHIVGAAEGLPEDMEDADVDGNDVRIRDLPALIIWACTQDSGMDVTVRFKRGDEVHETVLKLDPYGWSGNAPERFR